METINAVIVFLTSLILVSEISADVFIKDEICKPTSPDELGPYYYPFPPKRRQICDRTVAFHENGRLLVEGRVRNEKCQPILGARIEVWQADEEGHYFFEENCRGHFYSQKGGHYAFLTLHPGKYSTDPKRRLYRPAHVHFRVSAPGYNILVTQMYFSGDSSLGKNDSCADCSSASEDLVVDLTEMCADENRVYCFNIAHFDIVLRRGNSVDVVKDRLDSLPELLDASEVGKK